eukprot:COSAG04_NODE_4119_length_2286_cov_1.687700_3_plen_145_part_00
MVVAEKHALFARTTTTLEQLQLQKSRWRGGDAGDAPEPAPKAAPHTLPSLNSASPESHGTCPTARRPGTARRPNRAQQPRRQPPMNRRRVPAPGAGGAHAPAADGGGHVVEAFLQQVIQQALQMIRGSPPNTPPQSPPRPRPPQ